jgi:hypothetical protein
MKNLTKTYSIYVMQSHKVIIIRKIIIHHCYVVGGSSEQFCGCLFCYFIDFYIPRNVFLVVL